MPLIQVDLREGKTDEEKREIVKGIIEVFQRVEKGIAIENITVVLRESRGLHFVFGGKHVPEFKK